MTSKPPAPDHRPLFKKGGEASQSEGVADSPLIKAAAEAATMAAYDVIVEGVTPESGAGTLVGVRLQADLLARLDRARGGYTRPAFIRQLLELCINKLR